MNNGRFEYGANYYSTIGEAWNSDANLEVEDGWVQLRWDSAQTINRVVIHAPPMWQAKGSLLDYELQYHNGTKWVTIEHTVEPISVVPAYQYGSKSTVDDYSRNRNVFQHTFEDVHTDRIRVLAHVVTYGGASVKPVAEAGGQAWGTPRFTLREIEAYHETPPVIGTSNRAPDVVASASGATSGLAPFTVNLSGEGSTDPDGNALSYSWQFSDGTGATGKNVSKTFGTAGKYTATLTVSDGKGKIAAAVPINITVRAKPQVQLTLPVTGQMYRGGSTIQFAATGTDTEDGTLPPTTFKWEIVRHHADLTHAFLTVPGVKSGSFTMPLTGESDANQFYRIRVTVTDSDGQTASNFVDVTPRTSTIQLKSNVPGLVVTLDGVTKTTPSSFVGIEGMTRALAAARRAWGCS